MLKSSTIIGGSGANKRRELDFYSTPKEVTIALVKFFESIFMDFQTLHCWEPACGDGAMSQVLNAYGIITHSSDLRETGYGIPNTNYLTCERAEHNCIITNPPFSISNLFIERAIKEADTVAMLLKSQYWHARKRVPLFLKRQPAYILPLTWRPDFTKGGEGSPTMDMIWTVWLKDNNNATYLPLIKPQ